MRSKDDAAIVKIKYSIKMQEMVSINYNIKILCLSQANILYTLNFYFRLNLIIYYFVLTNKNKRIMGIANIIIYNSKQYKLFVIFS